MQTAFQKGQKVISPDGEGLIEEISGDEIIVRLQSGEIKTYAADDLEDDADPG